MLNAESFVNTLTRFRGHSLPVSQNLQPWVSGFSGPVLSFIVVLEIKNACSFCVLFS